MLKKKIRKQQYSNWYMCLIRFYLQKYFNIISYYLEDHLLDIYYLIYPKKRLLDNIIPILQMGSQGSESFVRCT